MPRCGRQAGSAASLLVESRDIFLDMRRPRLSIGVLEPLHTYRGAASAICAVVVAEA